MCTPVPFAAAAWLQAWAPVIPENYPGHMPARQPARGQEWLEPTPHHRPFHRTGLQAHACTQRPPPCAFAVCVCAAAARGFSVCMHSVCVRPTGGDPQDPQHLTVCVGGSFRPLSNKGSAQ
jgi:hypothetical protein